MLCGDPDQRCVIHPTADRRSVRRIRRFLRDVLTDWKCGELLIDNAISVVAELSNNVILHVENVTEFRVVVSREAGKLCLEVWDPSGDIPEPRHAGVEDTAGRGLAMVEALCESFEWRRDDHGKIARAVPCAE
ncbi:ATP-binding protein [Actinoallomurus sp. NPDC052274]|uniref:ATP-binding protein n=1 Tax=Actinoallomurus sp. NPDC052274 TaxID=3155420 RepID=UPI00343DC2FE